MHSGDVSCIWMYLYDLEIGYFHKTGLSNLSFETWNIQDKKLLAILLAASKKSVTRKWLKVEPPTIDEWIEIVNEIYVMEKISFSLKLEKEKFKIWTKWTEYLKPIRSDFT